MFDDIKFNINDISTWPLMYVEVLDSDFLGFDDDCLGYSYVWVSCFLFSLMNQTI